MRRVNTWTMATVGLLLAIGVVGHATVAAAIGPPACPGSQNQGNPNRPGPANDHGAGKVCGTDLESNITSFAPIHLELATPPPGKCPVLSVTPASLELPWDQHPNRIVWIIDDKSGFPYSEWDIAGGSAVWDDFVATSVQPFGNAHIGAGDPADPGDDAFWTEKANLPAMRRKGRVLKWKYTVKVGFDQKSPYSGCQLELDPIILFPGG